ncbi:flotillin-2-like [Dermatophagoides pteronyssinus]|uniref:flotillin-2-like n=1 Tax=Dermatophagoides pteronyssinus TaxID=6956 RepID=UPI003F68162C
MLISNGYEKEKMGNIHVVGPNEALIITGGLGCCQSKHKRMIIGTWCWIWWWINNVQLLSLEIFTIKTNCQNVQTIYGVPLCVTAIIHCRITNRLDRLKFAAEQFLGMTISQIRFILRKTIEGHIHTIVGTLSVEEICNDQIKFANLIRELAAKDLNNMGIDIVSLTINNIYDNVDYLDSLGRTRIAQVKQDAQIKIIESERDIRIIETECQQQSINQSLISKIKIETAKQQYEVKKFEYDCELNRQKTETELAYELQSIKIQQIQRLEEKKIELIKKQKSIQLEQLESELINQKLISDVRLPADNESDRIRIDANAGKNVHLMMAIAETEKIQQIGLAKINRNQKIEMAKANEMAIRTNILSNYNDVAILSMIMLTMPELAKEICWPLSRITEIVIISSSSSSSSSSAKTTIEQNI